MIVLRDVALAIGGRSLLSYIDARITSGEFVAILGPNGSGKTTLLRAIAGLHPLSSGAVTLDGASVHALTARERAHRVALVTSDDTLIEALRVHDVVSLGRFPYHRWWEWQTRDADDAAVTDALTAVGLDRIADRLLVTLSAGERQRVWIALGLAQATPILLLDEPTSHLDVRVAHEILDLLHRLARTGKSIVCALHDLNEAATYADRLALLGEGRLLRLAPPAQALEDPMVERVYGIRLQRVTLPDGSMRVFAHGPRGESNAGEPLERLSQAPNA